MQKAFLRGIIWNRIFRLRRKMCENMAIFAHFEKVLIGRVVHNVFYHNRVLFLLATILLATSCSVVKYVPEGETLLNRNRIKVKERNKVTPEELKPYLHQTQNQEVLSFMKVKLSIYSMSGRDSTKRINCWLRKVGEPPVIYDPYLVGRSRNELLRQLANKGYMRATVDTLTKTKRRRTTVYYNVKLNEPYIINKYDLQLGDDSATYFVNIARDSLKRIKEGDIFDLAMMDAERNRIATILRNRGYYNFSKDMLYFVADSSSRVRTIDLKLSLHPNYANNDSLSPYHRKRIRNVTIVMEDDPNEVEVRSSFTDTVWVDNYAVVYGAKRFINAKTLVSKVFVLPGEYFSENKVTQTYNALNFLSPIKYVDIDFKQISSEEIDCRIVVNPDRVHVVSAEIEGTNSAGNIGVGGNVGYQHKNIFRGAETFKFSVRGAYETMGHIGDAFYSSIEVGGNLGLDFPKFLFPLGSRFKKKLRATTELTLGYNYQKRPQYSRNIANANFRYVWNSYRKPKLKYSFDLFDFSYIYLPWITPEFKDKYLSPSSSLRYSYEDHFIMRIGFGLTYTTKRENRLQDFYTLRTRVRTAGNLLYGISNMINQKKVDGVYQIFKIGYAQFAKADFDFAYTKVFGDRHQLAFHTALGVAYPYGNADILPFEERYFSGGANSVRGWSVRTLGPGGFKNTSGSIDFMRQSGDIKLDLSCEYRVKLFWLLEGALFVDAGNIWTIKEYADQPDGVFRFNQFYKQIACSYGLGLRADFDFFILRFDFGFKLYDPSRDASEKWRTKITNDDFAFHFAIGYPF